MIELRPYQQEAVDAILGYWRAGGGNPLVDICTGGGKSLIIGKLARHLLEDFSGMRVLVLVHVRELVEQNAMALLRDWPGAPIGINSAGLGRRDRFSKILFASIQSVYRDDAYSLGRFDAVLIDECFVAGTMIETLHGPRAIEEISAGDAVVNALGIGFVLAYSRSKSHNFVRIELSDGKRLECTPNHPFFTDRGWIKASCLVEGTRLYRTQDVSGLRKGFQSGCCKSEFEDRDRVGRIIPLWEAGAGRSQERCPAEELRAVSVSHQKLSCPQDVFNLQISGHPSYYAEGALVHNCHLTPRGGEGMYRTLLEKLRDAVPDLRVAGFTATPYRLDSGRLDDGDGRLFDEVVYSYGIGEGVRDGYLSPLVSKGTGSEIDVAGVQRRGGEFVAASLEHAANKDELVEAAAREIAERGADRRSWLVFAAGVAHAEHVREAIRRQGVSCEVVSGETPAAERNRIIRAFKAGQIRCLSNCQVLTTGFDAPGVDLIAMLRPTLSTGLYVQCLGRGTRLAPGKSECLVLDFSGNVRRHGPVDAIVIEPRSTRDSGDKPEAVKVDTVRAKVCPSCGSYCGVATLTCADCGHQWPEPKPKHQAKPDDAPVMSNEVSGPLWIKVDGAKFRRHKKEGSPDSIRVEYECGLSSYREWVCFSHSGFAGQKAANWWRVCAGTAVPTSTDEALSRLSEIKSITEICVRPNGKFHDVVAPPRIRAMLVANGAVEMDEFGASEFVARQSGNEKQLALISGARGRRAEEASA